MSDAIASILPYVMGGTAAAGTAGNIYSSVEQGKTAELQQQQLKNELSYQNDPAKFAALVKSFMTPLSQGLIQSVTRASDASGASRGLADSPGLMEYIVSQALAPYAQQQQQQAGAEASQVAFPGSIGTPQYPQSNMGSSYAALMKMFPDIFGGGKNPSATVSGNPLTNFDLGGSISDINMGDTSSIGE